MSSDGLSRRGFLQSVAGAGAIAALGQPSYGAPDLQVRGLDAAPPGQLMPGWFDGPMRWVQLTLFENDPVRFDPQFWLD